MKDDALGRLDDAAVRSRCVKLTSSSDLQDNLAFVGGCLLIPAFVLLTRGYVGSTSRSGRYSPPAPCLIPYGVAALGASIAMLASLLGFQNYHLLDPLERVLYHHFRFLWWRRRRIVFCQGEVQGVTAEGKKVSSRAGVRWHYRLIAVGLDGRKEPLSNWRREGLEEWNVKARVVAAQLGCPSWTAPSESAPTVDSTGATSTLIFGSPPRKPGLRALLLRLIVISVLGFLYYRIVRKVRR